jgi:hypothetical protein
VTEQVIDETSVVLPAPRAAARQRAVRVSWRRHPLLMLRRRRRRMTGVEHLPVTTSRSEILARVASMPVSVWSYGWEDDVAHLGPMAQDFYRRFGLGDSDRRIDVVDSAGVLFACVQALTQRVEELEAELARRPPATAS